MKDLTRRVKKIMEDNPELRDDKNRTLEAIWRQDLYNMGYNYTYMAGELREGRLTPFESVARAWRITLEACPELRGPKYLKRKEKAKNYPKKELKEMKEVLG